MEILIFLYFWSAFCHTVVTKFKPCFNWVHVFRSLVFCSILWTIDCMCVLLHLAVFFRFAASENQLGMFKLSENEDRRMERLLTQTKHISGNLWHRNFAILFPTISETDIIKSRISDWPRDYHIWWTCAVNKGNNKITELRTILQRENIVGNKITKFLCHRLPLICFVCVSKRSILLSSFMTNHWFIA
jgi:hypothetical protein